MWPSLFSGEEARKRTTWHDVRRRGEPPGAWVLVLAVVDLIQRLRCTNSHIWVTEELRTAGLVTALSADGPAAFPALSRHVSDTRDGVYKPDLVTHGLGLAAWEFAHGRISEAHRIGEQALETALIRDPSGVLSAVLSLVSETSALLGKNTRSAALQAKFAPTALRSAATISGRIHGHLSAAGLLLETPFTGHMLGKTADQFIVAGQYGFASDVLYSGVRFGRRRAASALLTIADELDGNHHELRVAHAEALLDADPVALLAVSDGLNESGLLLHATEAAAAAARIPDTPNAVLKRAIQLVNAYLQNHEVPGHTLLLKVARLAASESTDLTPREREIALLIESGLTNREIAERLSLSMRTVEGHATRIYRKISLPRRWGD